VFYASHEPYLHAWVPSGKKTLEETPPLSGRERLTALSGKRIMAFSGLAENGNFIKTLREASCQIIDFSGFADHHAYSEDELKALGQEALQNKADLMVTTEKDFVKIPEDFSWPLNLGVVGIRISMGQDQEPFERFLLEHLRT
jgi:tetraacyldisaccharide 4'-kinase